MRRSSRISKQDRQVARDISYASSAKSRAGRFVIRTTENLTGRPRLIRMANGYQDAVARGEDFWQVISDRYNLQLDVSRGSLDNIPKDGPIIVVSNHPYGILDGLILGNILSHTRGDFRILAHRVFRRAEELNSVILPIAFDETKEALRTNIETRKTALSYLAQGGCIGVFPGGTVSTSAKPFGPAMDPVWRNFTARLILKSNATVVPIHFDGSNSRLFQLASHLHYTLRMALLISEFRKKIKEPVSLSVGDPIPAADIVAHSRDPKEIMDFLRAQTYSLAPKPPKSLAYGFEFEDAYR